VSACAVALGLGLGFVGWVGLGSAATDDTVLASRASGADGAKGNGLSRAPSLSVDGRFVAFSSGASNLDPDDSDSIYDVFVRDLHTDRTVLASRASGADGAKGNGASTESSISADGRFVVFASESSNLDPDDSEEVRTSVSITPTVDVFLRDLQTNTTVLVSRASGADGTNGNGGSWDPSVSPYGRFVAFSSNASNLDPYDSDETSDVFVRDLHTNRTVLASRASGADGAKGNGGSGEPSLSADGRFVAFTSMASNLHADDAYSTADVFVRDLQTNSTEVVSRRSGPAGALGGWGAWGPSISGDGHFVAFTALSSLDRDDREVDDGDVYVRHLRTSITTLVSRASGPAGADGNNDSDQASISADGRSVAFASSASNLHPYDSNTDRARDVFVRDLRTRRTALVSRASGPAGAAGNDSSQDPSISADGRFVAFGSGASNLHRDDRDSPDLANQDVFIREVGPSPLLHPPRATARGDWRRSSCCRARVRS
jgi:Tol biopolymer transport system component